MKTERNVIKERIEADIQKIRVDLYGADIVELRNKVAKFLDRTEATVRSADGWTDDRLFDIAKSQHTISIIVCSIVFVFAIGVMAGKWVFL